MKLYYSLFLISYAAWSDNSFYCPTQHGFIHPGMTRDEVIQACGQPTHIEQSKQPLVQEIPVTELIYTNLNQGAPYPGLNNTYQMWSITSGTTQVHMQINIIHDQIHSIQVNGSHDNATNVCGGTPLQIGDSADSVYSACGSPSMVNQTYIKEPIKTEHHAYPELWTYQVSPYDPPFHLTFLNNILQSISP